MQFYENRQEPERVLILSVETDDFDSAASVEELKRLVESAGGECCGVISQKREKPDTVTYIGAGKLEQAREYAENAELDLVVCDDELTPTQQRVLEEILKIRVIDRTVLILDIFAARAKTNEGKLQVELAQLKYSLPRLTGKGRALSRLGGGIGTRGPGESKLESDKRHIRRRIDALEQNLQALETRRGRHREKRKKDGVVTVAIVGYTNAGKSTLLNTLTDAGVLTEDKLFATLDPTSRSLKLPNGVTVMLIDTVGFVSRLPHSLVEAFKSTLEEALDADVLMILCDASDPDCEEQLDVTKQTLEELGAGDKPVLTVYNKCDVTNEYVSLFDRDEVRISAKNGVGIERLLEALGDKLPEKILKLQLFFGFENAGLPARLRQEGTVIKEEYRENGIYCEALLRERYASFYAGFIIRE